eukprot:TRINITY_DN29034_c0_g1_i1.p1 TRINITY_DN29034_c0_g1~~TRINITY_DN29034_c0_g1_i1.p1  ORF type:complete len:197 (+),score=48.45 TRINITY_DN29034_c0_g1_i1:238-828(+)
MFFPLEPVPARFEVSVLFNDEECKTMTTSIAPIDLDFADLFLPVQLPQSTVPRTLFLELLFNELWNRVLDESTSSATGVQTVKHIHAKSTVIENYLEDDLRHFEVICSEEGTVEGTSSTNSSTSGLTNALQGGVDWNEDSDQEGQPRQFLILLPPKSHLLFKFFIHENHTVVRIRTDNWNLLSFLDDAFADLGSTN